MDNNVFFRLKNERLRLKLGQNDVADVTDVAVKTVGRWEKEIAIPSDKLSLLASLGFDVLYVLTGVRSASTLTDEETVLLNKYRAADADTKNKMLMLLLGIDTASVKQPADVGDFNQNFNGGVGGVTNVKGSVTQRIDSFIKK